MPPFEYTPFNPAPYAASVGDLLARSGDAQARAAIAIGQAQARAQEVTGQAWAGAVTSAAQIPTQLARATATQQESQSLAALRQSEIDKNQQDLAVRNRGLKGQQLLGQLTQQYSTPDPITGISDVNHEAIANDLSKAGYGTEAQQYLHGASAAAEDIEKIKATRRANASATAESIGKAASNASGPEDFLSTLDHYTVAGALDPATRAQFAQEVQQAGPDGWSAVRKRYMDWAEGVVKPTTVGKDVKLVSGIDPTHVLVDNSDPNEGSYTINGQRFTKDGKPIGAIVPTQAAPKSIESKNVLLDGKPAIVNFNPANGAHTLPDGTDVSTRVKPIPAPSTIINPAAQNDVKETVAGMKDGTLPPMMPGRATKEYLATMAEAHRQGYDLQGAVTDWNATQKHIATMNGAQQLRLNQSINALPDMLDKVDALASQWHGGSFPILNKANLALAKGGAYGKDVASVATQLDAQIADVTADLGNVYMGGNSPTDHALGLAGKSLSGDWDEKVLHDMTNLARSNVTVRSNSIKHTGVAGASDSNPYGNQPPAAAAAASSGVPSNVAAALKGIAPGLHTLSDGLTWIVAADGSVSKGR